MNIGILLLAAGSSSRLGQSKQLLEIEGVPLLRRAALSALESGIGPITVVLGANEAAHRKALVDLAVEVISNRRWETGMGSSLKAGLAHMLMHTPATEAVLIMVCDQPLVTSVHLKTLAGAFSKAGKKIAASFYSGTGGVPAIFHKALFPELTGLPDAQGARKIISLHPELTHTINLPEGAFDLDTPEDLNALSAPKQANIVDPAHGPHGLSFE